MVTLGEGTINTDEKIRLFVYGTVLALSCANFSYAQNSAVTDCNAIDIKATQRPGTAGKPTEVAAGLRPIDVTGIEETSRTIAVDFMVTQE